MEVYVASANPHKAAELQALTGRWGVTMMPRPEWVPGVVETGTTLEENARLKAAVVQTILGAPAIADDTGLAVDALGGRPGVRSARYAGAGATDEDNRSKLLAELAAAGAAPRTARFETVVVLRTADGTEWVGRGAVEGTIARSEAGDEGFGYDSLFVPAEGDGHTFAQMSPAEKNAISHRARAVENLMEQLGELLGQAR